MKCQRCHGTGKTTEWVATDTVSEYEFPCRKCNGTGEVELTNEEWRRTCSTEEFASWLMKHFSCDDIIVLWAKHNYPTHETADGLKCADYKEAIRRWLKEKHHEV